MSFPVIKASYKAEDLKIDPYEVLRYLGYKRELVTQEDVAQVEALLPKARAAIKPAVCWSRFEVELLPDNKIRFPYGTVHSADLSRNLRGGAGFAFESVPAQAEEAVYDAKMPPSNTPDISHAPQPASSSAPAPTPVHLASPASPCFEVFIFAATIGIACDRLVQTARLSSMAEASFLNAIGAAAVEDVCDRLNDELRQFAASEGKSVRPRYSPGYGDYDLENQRGIFSLLEPAKHIGLTLKDNLIMVPEKSVTAVVGIVN